MELKEAVQRVRDHLRIDEKMYSDDTIQQWINIAYESHVSPISLIREYLEIESGRKRI